LLACTFINAALRSLCFTLDCCRETNFERGLLFTVDVAKIESLLT